MQFSIYASNFRFNAIGRLLLIAVTPVHTIISYGNTFPIYVFFIDTRFLRHN